MPLPRISPSGLDVVFHDGLHTVLLYGADLHADGTAFVARHDGAAAIVDELVLLDAPVPDLLLDQGSARAAVHAHLTFLAELVDAVVNGLVVCYGRVGGDDHEPRARAEVRGQQLAVRAKLSESGGDEHGYVRRAVVVGAVYLCMVALFAYEGGEFKAHCAFHLVGAEVREFGFETGNRLCLPEVLFEGEADGVFVLDPPALALVGVVAVEAGEADFTESKFPGLQPELLGHVFADFRLCGRLNFAGNDCGVHQGLVDPVVLFAILSDIVGIDCPDPLAVCRLLDVLRLDWFYPRIEGDIHVVLAYARDRCQILRDRNVVIRIAVQSPRTLYNVTNLYFFFRDHSSPLSYCGVMSVAEFTHNLITSQDKICMNNFLYFLEA